MIHNLISKREFEMNLKSYFVISKSKFRLSHFKQVQNQITVTLKRMKVTCCAHYKNFSNLKLVEHGIVLKAKGLRTRGIEYPNELIPPLWQRSNRPMIKRWIDDKLIYYLWWWMHILTHQRVSKRENMLLSDFWFEKILKPY